MLIWIRENKRKVASWFVYPLVLVFIALYGSSSVSNRMEMNERTAVKVNGERVMMDRYHAIEQEVSQSFSNSLVRPEKSATQLALEKTIETEIARQLSESLGLWTDDSLVGQVIAQQFGGGTGFVNQAAYQYFLQRNGFGSHEAYRELLRARMNVGLALNYVRGTAVPVETDIERGLRGQTESRSVELLMFKSEDYFDQIEATTEEVEDYFHQHIERYRFPKRMKIDYVEVSPSDYIAEATPDSEKMELERWFRSEKEQFLVPASRDVSVCVFAAGRFRDQVEVSDEELKAHYELHQTDYKEPEKFRARYIAVSVEVPDASIEAEMLNRREEFLSEEEAVAARHILLKTPADLDPEAVELVKQQIEEIRSRIVTEEDFIREAKAHSEDVSNKSQGGDLGFFGKGRMVTEFADAAFSIDEGTVSAPVKTVFGYHLIWVYDRRGAGELLSAKEGRYRVLQDIDANPLKETARTKLEAIKSALAGKSLAAASAVTDLPVLETGWFARGEAPSDDINRDKYPFYEAVANLGPGSISEVVEGFTSFYLIETIEMREERLQPFEEVKTKVETAYRTEKAGDLAREKAREAASKIRSGSLTFEEVAEAYGLPEPVAYEGLRSPGEEQLPANRTVDRETVNRAFTGEEGEVEGPFDTLQGATLLKVVRDNPEHLPELEEVRETVEEAYRKVLAERLAEDQVWNVWAELDKHASDLKASAETVGLEAKTSDYFRPGEPIPGFPSDSVVNYVAAGLRVVGATSQVLEDPPKNPNNPEPVPVRAYYLVRVATLEETRLPRFEEVSDQVWQDVKLEKGAVLAKADAEKALLGISDLLAAATEPLSASKSLELKSFADENGIEFLGPIVVPYRVHIPALPGKNSGAPLAGTVYELPLGGVSQVVPFVELAPEGNIAAERVHGYCIAQLIDVKKPATGGPSRGEVFRVLSSQVQDSVQADWSERSRIGSEIAPNKHLFSEELIQELTAGRGKS